MRKIIKLAALAATVTAPLVAVVSCSGKEAASTPEILMLRDNDGGNMTAFTRAIYNESKKAADSVGVTIGTKEVAKIDQRKAVKNAIDAGTKVFILASYDFNVDALAKEFTNAKFIAIDQMSGNANSNVANVWAESQQHSFLGGYLVGKWVDAQMKKTNRTVNFAFHNNAQPGDSGANKVKIGYSGGFSFETVTRFYDGLRAGVEYWNKNNNSTSDYDIDYMLKGQIGEKITVNSNQEWWDHDAYAGAWDVNSQGQKTVWQKMVDAQSDIVIGNGNLAAYNAEHANNEKIWSIYPDADVETSSPTELPFTILSLIKNVGPGSGNIIKRLYNKTNPSTADFTQPFNVSNGGLDADGMLGIAKNNLGDAIYGTVFNADGTLKTTGEAATLVAAAKNAWYRQKPSQTWAQYVNSITPSSTK